MNENVSRDYVVLINAKGDRKIVKSSGYENRVNEATGELKGYRYDIDWYLSHGFIEAKRMFDEIEGKNIDSI